MLILTLSISLLFNLVATIHILLQLNRIWEKIRERDLDQLENYKWFHKHGKLLQAHQRMLENIHL